ncbi:MAG TPA: cell division protein FtsL [Candidatus Salinicoccus stercoripullorum]|uniref:Cell division protein FtsL n=1 Tax=Candidatus Salinicoccus stercoripullorum TaxID=2838756 RepID=A0A9D1TYP7_9STAP|nr:cell division protein FtsL [Candidatus Salinicoccus stercoripullorum]
MAVESYRRNVLPESQVEPKSGEKSGTRTRTRIVSLKKAETLVYLTLFVLIAAAAIFVLSLKMEAYELQTEKMQLENEIAIKEGEISELKTEVTHLASYDRIYEKANELGLDLNNGNVKVAEKYGKD